MRRAGVSWPGHHPRPEEDAIPPAPGDRPLEVLETLARQPATSYYEGLVATQVRGLLKAAGLPVQTDDYGNLLARVAQGGLARR